MHPAIQSPNAYREGKVQSEGANCLEKGNNKTGNGMREDQEFYTRELINMNVLQEK